MEKIFIVGYEAFVIRGSESKLSLCLNMEMLKLISLKLFRFLKYVTEIFKFTINTFLKFYSIFFLPIILLPMKIRNLVCEILSSFNLYKETVSNFFLFY